MTLSWVEFLTLASGTPGEENGNLLQYSCLENSIDKGAWLLGASVRNPTHDKVMRQRSDVQGRVRSQVFPLEFPEHPPPKNKNLPAFPLF